MAPRRSCADLLVYIGSVAPPPVRKLSLSGGTSWDKEVDSAVVLYFVFAKIQPTDLNQN